MSYLTFRPEMARAYREGRKTMTRRLINWPKWIQADMSDAHAIDRIVEIINSNEYRGVIKRGYCDGTESSFRCRHGKPGDKITLGTTWAVRNIYDDVKPTDLPTFERDNELIPLQIWSYFDSDEKPPGFGRLRPGMFLPGFLRDLMPHETIEILRAERLKEITEEEAIREGIVEVRPGEFSENPDALHEQCLGTARFAFAALINRIHGGPNWNYYHNDAIKYPEPIWDVNPYVFAIGW
jgi:hypothetical protein